MWRIIHLIYISFARYVFVCVCSRKMLLKCAMNEWVHGFWFALLSTSDYDNVTLLSCYLFMLEVDFACRFFVVVVRCYSFILPSFLKQTVVFRLNGSLWRQREKKNHVSHHTHWDTDKNVHRLLACVRAYRGFKSCKSLKWCTYRNGSQLKWNTNIYMEQKKKK